MMTEQLHCSRPHFWAHPAFSDDCGPAKQSRPSLLAINGRNSLSILRRDICVSVSRICRFFTGQGFSRFRWNDGGRIRTCSVASVAQNFDRDPFCFTSCLLNLPRSCQGRNFRTKRTLEERQQSVICALFCCASSDILNEVSNSNCQLRFHGPALNVQCRINSLEFQLQDAPSPSPCGMSYHAMSIVRQSGKQHSDWEATMTSGKTFGVRPVFGTSTRGRRFRANAMEPDAKGNWWQNFLFQPIPIEQEEDEVDDSKGYDTDDPLLDILDDENIEATDTEPEDDIDQMLADDKKFSEWQRNNALREEIREFRRTGRDPDSRDWEDWLEADDNSTPTFGIKDKGWYYPENDWEKNGMPRFAPKKPVRGMKRTVVELFFRMFEPQEEVEEDLKFEERIFRYTSQESAKFATILIVVPFLLDFSVHDYVLVPFMKRYVDTVPLVAEVLDVRRTQKLMMVRELKLERQRVRFEAELGKAPPLFDEELADHMRHKALELQEEYRAENRAAFASIWSDLLAVFTFLTLLVLNPKKVAILSLTGDRLFTNISDTGKAFIIILLTDIFLGYHSSMGWETVIEMVLERYGLDADQGAIYLFVAIVPVTIDAIFKLWVFRYFTRLSPSAAATFREMSRH